MQRIDCNLIGKVLVFGAIDEGSRPSSLNRVGGYGAVVACLFVVQKVIGSNPIIRLEVKEVERLC